MFQNLGRWKEGFCRLGGEVMFGKDERGGEGGETHFLL